MRLDFEKVYETLPADGWLTKGEARLLWVVANLTRGPILEIGAYKGRSTVLLSHCVAFDKDRVVHTVDPFDGFTTDHTGDEIYRTLLANLYERKIMNVQVHRCKIEDWPVLPCGFAYLDGDHTYRGTLNQVSAALACGVRDLCVHDYNDSGGGAEVKQAILHSGLNVYRVQERMAFCGVTPVPQAPIVHTVT